MKLITPIWSNPIGWAEQGAKTKLRIVIWVAIHAGFVALGLFMIYTRLTPHSVVPFDDAYRLHALLSGAFPIVFIGVLYPAMYLYAMHRLLQIIKRINKDAEPGH